MNTNNWLLLINVIAIFVFSIMTIAGMGAMFEYLNNYETLENRVIAASCLFLFGAFGLLFELFFYNLKSLKK